MMDIVRKLGEVFSTTRGDAVDSSLQTHAQEVATCSYSNEVALRGPYI